MRVYLDANSLFSACLPNSRLAVFVRLLKHKGECLYSNYALNEAAKNLGRKFPVQLPELAGLTSGMSEVPDHAGLSGVEIRAKDEPSISAAIAAGATHLLTGDKRDFGPFFGKTIQGVKIVTAAMLASELDEAGLLD